VLAEIAWLTDRLLMHKHLLPNGTYLCTDLACSLYLRGKKPVVGLGGRFRERLTVEEQIERTMTNLAAFASCLVTNPGNEPRPPRVARPSAPAPAATAASLNHSLLHQPHTGSHETSDTQTLNMKQQL
jgi:FBP C-terminal treble-clef zinc-finger